MVGNTFPKLATQLVMPLQRVDRSSWSEDQESAYVKKGITSIQTTTGKTPRGWYYGMVDSKAAERSRTIVAKVYEDLGLELKYWADDYSDDLPH